MTKFSPLREDRKFPDIKKEIPAFWKRINVFERSLELSRGGPAFVLSDGPQFPPVFCNTAVSLPAQ
jgi:isoleucyl-tRNA synthetase